MKYLIAIRRTACLVIAMLLLSLTALPRADEANPPPRILVAGEGSVALPPDMALLDLTVTREAPTARAALTENSSAMNEVLRAMATMGVAERDRQTAHFSIQPRYSRPTRQSNGVAEQPRIVGYIVRNGLTVRVRDLGKLGEILDKSVTLGVNEGGNIRFINGNASAAIARARGKAVEQARNKAQTLATAAGVKIGRVLEISEQSRQSQPVPMARAARVMDRESSVPVAAGENTYKVSVNVAYAIK